MSITITNISMIDIFDTQLNDLLIELQKHNHSHYIYEYINNENEVYPSKTENVLNYYGLPNGLLDYVVSYPLLSKFNYYKGKVLTIEGFKYALSIFGVNLIDIVINNPFEVEVHFGNFIVVGGLSTFDSHLLDETTFDGDNSVSLDYKVTSNLTDVMCEKIITLLHNQYLPINLTINQITNN